jgi:predicted nucleotidyltransferase component of viral defense system
VFKGGTSLSKAYNLIKRFSEDVDLAVIPQAGLSQDKLKKLLKDIETRISEGLTMIEEGKIRKGRNRSSNYDYPKIFLVSGPLKKEITIELNAFTNPVPHQMVAIESYLSQFLRSIDRMDLINGHDMDSFSINVLSLERTFFEKLLSLNRLSYEGLGKLKEKIRHFYDLHQLYHSEALKLTILQPQSHQVLSLVLQDDHAIATFDGPWKGKPLAASPLFSELEVNWKEVTPAYTSELSELIWEGELPKPQDVLEIFKLIKEFLKNFDKEKKYFIEQLGN